VANPILKRAIEKRDEALREVERWEEWIKAYAELSEPGGLAAESLDIPMAPRASLKPEVSETRDFGPALRAAADTIEAGNGQTIWPRA
jgi:hypothetical protein